MKRTLSFLTVVAASMFIAASFAAIATYSENEADGTEGRAMGSAGTGTPDTSWYSAGSMSFILSNADQLAGLATLVNGGNNFSGKTITLANDIDLSNYGGGAAFNSGKGWIPIGDNSKNFMGIFDGDGKKVTGLYINDATLDYVGLFGFVYNGTIKRIGVEGADIIAKESVGGIVGINYGSVTNCYSTGSVRGASYVGGIAGQTNGTISNCYSTANVTGTGLTVGGITGWLSIGSSVTNCYSTGNVTGNSNCVGGIVGIVYDVDSVVKECAALNETVKGNGYVGRVAGDNTTGGTVTDCLAFDGMVLDTTGAEGENGTDITISEIIADGTIGGMFTEANGWTVQNGKLPGLFGGTVDRPEHLQLPKVTVTFSVVGSNGTLAAKAGTVTITSPADVEEGSSVTFTASPASGYRVKEWKNGTAAVAGNKTNTYTVSNITGATTVTVEFELIPVVEPGDDPKGGSSVALIVGIIAIIAIAGFAVYWFVLRKQ